jgi:hypothetical protein
LEHFHRRLRYSHSEYPRLSEPLCVDAKCATDQPRKNEALHHLPKVGTPIRW